MSKTFVLALAISLASPLSAQDVVVIWGDSIMTGLNSGEFIQNPAMPDPFGSPVPNSYRWDPAIDDWVAITHQQNLNLLPVPDGADPAYGFAAAWQAFRGTPLYIVHGAVPGSDIPIPAGGGRHWHPATSQLLWPALAGMIDDASASLTAPELQSIVFSIGNNDPTIQLATDIEAVHAAIRARFPGAAPIEVGVRSWKAAQVDTTINRKYIPIWANQAPTTRRYVEGQPVSDSYGLITDGTHLSHEGNIGLGVQLAFKFLFG